MKQYIKNGEIKYRNQIVLHCTKTVTDKNGNEKVVKLQIISPKEEQLLADGWVEYIPMQVAVEGQVDSNDMREISAVDYTPLPNTTILEVPEEAKDKAAFVRARHRLRNNIQNYDSSKEVNCFYIGDAEIWLDKATRAGLKLRFEAEVAMGAEETTLWYNNIQFPLKLEIAVQMLYAIEVYASACYDNTQKHLAELSKLTTLEEVESYDYKTGYPEKLRF